MMDARKQKRLGPAPIASFEKSFEDNNAPLVQHISNSTGVNTIITYSNIYYTSNATINTSTTQSFVINSVKYSETKDIENSPVAIETSPLDTVYRTTTNQAAIMEIQCKTEEKNTTVPKIDDNSKNMPTSTTSSDIISFPIELSPLNSDVHVKLKIDANSSGNIDGSIDATTTINGKQRPPPLKTAQAKVTTTLVSSSEGQITYRGATTLMTPSTPRIELSRASSSSHHEEEESRESSPENVFDQVGHGTLQETIAIGFREDGALELRSSTEELCFMDPEQKKTEHDKLQQIHYEQQQQKQEQPKRASPHIFKFDDHQQTYLQQHQRKDSASSEVAALLCISGRTSRISSVGSQGSAVSRLSVISGMSRSPSPHRMLLETSFCGPKPLKEDIDSGIPAAADPENNELLEQTLLARKHDPTRVVLAKGIEVECSPKKIKPTSLSNGSAKPAKVLTQGRTGISAIAKSVTAMGSERRGTKSPGQMVIGKTPGGTEYIRINLKPDYMYSDNGIAPNERVVEAPNTLAPIYAKNQIIPVTLSLEPCPLATGANVEHRLTPSPSPNPIRHFTSGKESHDSRSPSPITVSASRKSSFSSLFRLGGNDSPDSPRERSRSRSKSKERQAPQSQNATPSKQKSVLAIFKTGKRGSSGGTEAKTSKCSSPIDGHEAQNQRSKTATPVVTATSSRPNSRLRYYDEPVEGVIHIPLHTPPDEKETRKLLQDIQQLNGDPLELVAVLRKPNIISNATVPSSVPVVLAPTAITPGQLAAATAALKHVNTRNSLAKGTEPPSPISQLIRNRIENLDLIHPLSQSNQNKQKESRCSIEVNQDSSQDSHKKVASDASLASAIRATTCATTSHSVTQNSGLEYSVAAEPEIRRLSSVESAKSSFDPKYVQTVATINTSAMEQEELAAMERRKLLFATRLGSGSDEQIFSTQFSISKTESQSSHLSEQLHDTMSEENETLQRQETIIRRIDEETDSTHTQNARNANKATTRKMSKQKSLSTSDDERLISVTKTSTSIAPTVVMRGKSSSDNHNKSRSTSEEDAEAKTLTNQRHSRYLDSFDVHKKHYEHITACNTKGEIDESNEVQVDEVVSQTLTVVLKPPPSLPQPPPPSTAPTPSPPPLLGDFSPLQGCYEVPTPNKTSRQRSLSRSPIEHTAPIKPPRTTTPTRQNLPAATTQNNAIIQKHQTIEHQKELQISPSKRQSVHSIDEPNESSESERDFLAASTICNIGNQRCNHFPRHVGPIEEHESTGLVSQESFEDELPYIPTTLPEERAHGVSLIPMKERVNMELKTCPVERPRSTTPLNPSHLEEYCGIVGTVYEHTPIVFTNTSMVRGEKLRISLPRKDSAKEKPQNTKSPRRISSAGSTKSWFEFAEEGLRAGASSLERRDSNKQLVQQQRHVEDQCKPGQQQLKLQQKEMRTPTYQVPIFTGTAQTLQNVRIQSRTKPTTLSTHRKLSGHWIDFENIPEKRKPPKRITTLPKEATTTTKIPIQLQQQKPQQAQQHHQSLEKQPFEAQNTAEPTATGEISSYHNEMNYNYVNPEDCQCECHEFERETQSIEVSTITEKGSAISLNITPLTNVDLLQQGDDMLPLLDSDTHDRIERSDSSRDYSCYTDDEMDVPTRQSTSSRSRSSSSRFNQFPRRDVSHSPRNKKFPDKK